MQHKHLKQTGHESTTSVERRGFGRWHVLSHKQRSLVAAVMIIIVILLIILLVIPGEKEGRTTSYKPASGAAGLHAAIEYDCKTDCSNKFGFNVYILGEDGQQVSVVRPDQNGHVRLALPEGDYVMLIGKQFGRDNLFPQEPIALKNGKELELKLHYR